MPRESNGRHNSPTAATQSRRVRHENEGSATARDAQRGGASTGRKATKAAPPATATATSTGEAKAVGTAAKASVATPDTAQAAAITTAARRAPKGSSRSLHSTTKSPVAIRYTTRMASIVGDEKELPSSTSQADTAASTATTIRTADEAPSAGRPRAARHPKPAMSAASAA